MGCVTATYVPGLKKYLMCVTDGWPTVAKMTSYILEADAITGPWRMVSYMKDFGEQGYFLNFPSKFISPDGQDPVAVLLREFQPRLERREVGLQSAGRALRLVSARGQTAEAGSTVAGRALMLDLTSWMKHNGQRSRKTGE